MYAKMGRDAEGNRVPIETSRTGKMLHIGTRVSLKEGGAMTIVVERRELDHMPFDKTFITENGSEELCHATGWERKMDGQWWNEYIDSEDNLYYGR